MEQLLLSVLLSGGLFGLLIQVNQLLLDGSQRLILSVEVSWKIADA